MKSVEAIKHEISLAEFDLEFIGVIGSLIKDERWLKVREKLEEACAQQTNRLCNEELNQYQTGRAQGFLQAARIILVGPERALSAAPDIHKTLESLALDLERAELHELQGDPAIQGHLETLRKLEGRPTLPGRST